MSIIRAVLLGGIAILPSAHGAEVAKEKEYQPWIEPASDEGEKAIRRFQVTPGFKTELFAAEPMLANPVCFYVDHQGRFFVAETFRHEHGVTDMREHTEWLDDDLACRTLEDRLYAMRKNLGADFASYSDEQDRIRLIEDRDGDGKADSAVVYADGFRDALAGIGAGLLLDRGDMFYTCIPDLWKLRDEDGDGRADSRKVLSFGYGVHINFLGHDSHGLRKGPDGKLYFTIGDRGIHIKTEHGLLAYPDTGTVLRCNLDGTGLEVVHYGLRNPQELAFDDYGNLFTGDNNSDGGDQARWVYIVEGGDSGWRIGYQWQTEPVSRGVWNTEKMWLPQWKGQAAYILPPIANIAAGPSGLTYYPGTGLPRRYAGHFFLCDFRGDAVTSRVHAFKVKPKGATFELVGRHDFIKGMLATDVDFGMEGGLYLTDWVQGWHQPKKGRIYHVFDPRLVDDALIQQTKRLLAEGMRDRSSEQLGGLLRHPDQRVRLEAQWELADRGSEGFDVFEPIARGDDFLLARLHAIWGMGQLARTGEKSALVSVLTLLKDTDAEVRAQAAKVLGAARYEPAAGAFIAALKDPSARVRFFAAIGLGKIGTHDAVDPLKQMLRENADADPYLRHAGVMGLVGCARYPEDMINHDGLNSPSVRMGDLLALRRLRRPEVAYYLADPDPLLAREAARAINDAPIEAAMPALAAMIGKMEGKAESFFTIQSWSGVEGDRVADLTAHPDFPLQPTEQTFSMAMQTPEDGIEGSSSRISGWIVAPQSGDYRFEVRADGAVELWLSPSADPTLRRKIIATTRYSDPIGLEAGERYYVEALHQGKRGAGRLVVGWRRPDGVEEWPIGDPVVGDAPILYRVLNANFRLGKPENARALARFATRETAPAFARLEALRHLSHWEHPSGRDRIVGVWRPLPPRETAMAALDFAPILEQLLRSQNNAVEQAAARLAAQYHVSESTPTLMRLLTHRGNSAEVRIEALRAMAALEAKNLGEAIRIARQDRNPRLRSQGNRILARLDPERAIGILTQTLDRGAMIEKQEAFETLARMQIPQADTLLVEWMDRLLAGQAPPEVRLELLQAAERRSTEALRDRIERHEASMSDDDPIKGYRDALAGGDARRGERVFFDRVAVSCQRCHVIGGRGGGEVGPDLSDIGARQDREYILTSIVAPNAAIAEGHETISITLDDGSEHTGRVVAEDDETLRLEVVALSGEAAYLGEGEYFADDDDDEPEHAHSVVDVTPPDEAESEPGLSEPPALEILTVAKSRITSMRRGLSAMPEGLTDALSKSELRDLVQYLAGLKG